MKPRSPLAQLPTHEVANTPPHLGDQDLWANDPPLRIWCEIHGAGWAQKPLARLGKLAGLDETFEKANQANRYGPELRAYDRYGMRLNLVEFHPSYHALMDLAVSSELHNFAWRHPQSGAHVANAALNYQFSQPEGGVLCPMSMTYSVPPSLKATPSLEALWMPRILSTQYDSRDIPVEEKTGALLGMFMTEKQGGSDVRTNSTRALPLTDKQGMGAEYSITGHKFFCSAPMCDAFLILARTAAGLSCFIVPRWRPDGTRNGLFLQRLKDKLGNRSNASTEMELQDTYGVMLGEETCGIKTIIEMVTGNRLYCAMASAGLMRQSLVQALHHTRNRIAFQRRLSEQPLMQNVLADMAIEVEAALALGLRVAKAMDQPSTQETALSRIGTAVAKYWNCKRTPMLVVEALECHGGPGYVEESIMPRLYREAPLNGIWEGSGNIMGLDVLRALTREPEAAPALIAELDKGLGQDQCLDASIAELRQLLQEGSIAEYDLRAVTERIALCWQGALLVQHSPQYIADAFCQTRLAPRYRGAFGSLPKECDFRAILQRALPD